jgi:tetratricopeptide (TPR) repeat protein
MATEVPQEVLAKADAMDDNKEFDALYTFLYEQEKAHPDHFEITWRLARINFDMSSEKPAQKKEYLLKAFDYAEKLLKMQPDHYLSHKWYAIVLSALSDFRSTKEKIIESVQIKEHCLKSIELHGRGGDQTLNHLLGRWCFAVSSISWMERKLASALFAAPPESSYDEALKYFLGAEAINERDEFLENLLWTAHTYHKLNNVPKAKEYYARASKVQPKSSSDIEIIKEAQQKHARL